MFCMTVLCGNRLNAWNTIPMWVRILLRSVRMSVRSRPRNQTLPSLGISSRFTQRSSVDFPEPDGPMTTCTSPGSRVRSIPFRTWLLPNHLCDALDPHERLVVVVPRPDVLAVSVRSISAHLRWPRGRSAAGARRS